MPGLKVSVSIGGLEQLAERLRVVAAEIHPKVAEAFLANAKRTAVVAQAKAAEHSQKIPSSIRALPTESGAIVQAGDSSVPLAALMERGSARKPDPSEWRHPVYGNRRNWVTQKTHPYLRPAVTETLTENETRLVAALTDLARETIGRELA